MGHFRVPVEVGDRAGTRFVAIDALVDTGATYTWVSRDVLEGLGVVPDESWPFELADGREVEHPVAWITIRMGERGQPTIAVFGEPGADLILGIVTLEEFRLAVDSVNRRLISVPGLLKAACGPPCPADLLTRRPVAAPPASALRARASPPPAARHSRAAA